MVAIERNLWVIRGMLADGEEQRTWVKVRRLPQQQQGALALSPRRVLFAGQGSFRSMSLSYPLAIVGAAEVAGDELRMQVEGREERFKGKTAELEAFLAALDECRGGPVARQDATTLGGELEKLAALHASGAISDDEFAQAKARLLS